MSDRAGLILLLVVLGAGWGITQPLAKIAVSEGYRHVGIVFWQLAIGAVILGAVTFVRGRRLPLEPRHIRLYILIACIGTVVPNGASYQAAVHLPSGILSIVLSLVPIFAFPVALSLGIDRFSGARFLGLCLGLGGVLMIALPETSLPDRAMVAFLPLALIAPFLYAVEGNYVAKWGTERLDPVQVLFGSSVAGALISAPLALASGEWISPLPPWGLPDGAILLSSIIHAIVYSAYVWLVGRAGAVFAAQVSYLVTGFGVVWAMLLLGERYSTFIWLALLLMFGGLFLVQPRPKPGLVNDREVGEDAI